MSDIYSGLDDDQHKAVEANTNTVVAAGAGSGKTTVLARRYARLIKDGLADVESILTLTFTRKAAAEMHLRIYGLLKEAVDDERLKREAGRFDLSRISTLDSFSSSVVRNFSHAYGIPPSFSLDEDEARKLAGREALTFLLENGERMSLEYLVQMNGFQTVLDGFTELGLSSLSAGAVRDFQLMHEEQMRILLSGREKIGSEILSAAEDILRIDLTASPGKNGEAARGVQREIEKTLSDDSGARSALCQKLSWTAKAALPRGAVADAELLAYKELLSRLKDLMKSLPSIEDTLSLRPQLEDLFELLAGYQEKILKAKRSSGVLTFRDCSELAVTILKENKELRSFYKKKFKAIMIDEFQDNNRLQKDLLYLLAEREDLHSEGIPKVEALDTSKLFFVGDEKQSIYRFRGADVRVFKGLSNELKEGGGTPLRLDTNYRSDPGLLEFFNYFFPRVMQGEEGAEFEADFEPLKAPPKTETAQDGPKVVLFCKPYKDKNESAEDEVKSDEAEAYFLAKRIRNYVDSGSLTVKGKNGPRPAVYTDFAILMRSTSNQIIYEKMFRLFDVPYTTNSIRSLFIEAPVNDIYSLLQTVVYPEDRTAYAAVLRSPFVNAGDDAVLKILLRENAPFADLGDLLLSEDDRKKYEEGAALYRRILEMADSSSTAAVLSFLWYEAGYRYSLLRDSSFHPYLELYDYLIEFALRVPGETLSSFLDRVRPNLGQYERIPDLEVQHDESEGVQILTVHKSKGLEYPVVILANAGNIGRRGEGGSLYHDSEKYGLCFNLGDRGAKHNYFYELGKEEAESAEIAELKRLLYVACTRAESRLIISGSFTKTNRKSPKSFLTMTFQALGLDPNGQDCEVSAFSGLYRIETIPDVLESDLRTRSPSGPAGLAEAAEFYGREEKTRKIGRNEYSVTEIADMLYGQEERGSLSGGGSAVGGPGLSGAALPAAEIQPAAALPATAADSLLSDASAEAYFGSLCHRVIEERLLRRHKRSGEPLKSRCPVPEFYPLLLSEAERLADLFLSSAFAGRLFLEARKIESEVPFLSRLDLSSGTIRVRGQIDFAAVLADKVVILDFKTDRMMVPGRHSVQLGLYGEAAREIWDRPAETWLVYLRSGEAVRTRTANLSLLSDLIRR